MSLRALIWAFDQIRAKRVKTAGAKLVLLKIADRSNDDFICWPGRQCLGEDIDLTEPTVRQALRDLEHGRLIKIERRKDAAGRDLSNRYHLAPAGEGQNFYPRGEKNTSGGLNFCPESIKRTNQGKTTTKKNGGGTENLEEFLEAAFFASATTIKNPGGFKAKVRQRLLAAGPTAEDREDLRRWRAHQTRLAADQKKINEQKNEPPPSREKGRAQLAVLRTKTGI